MIKITLAQRQYLESIGLLKPNRGQFDSMVVCSKHKNSKGKSYYVENRYLYYLQNSKNSQKVSV